MKRSRLAVLVFAVAAAGGAFMLANTPKPEPVQVAGTPAPPPPPTTDDVLVTSKDIATGSIVSGGELAWQPWPKTNLAPGMILKAAEPTALDDIKGSIARANFFQGEPVHREKLIKGANAGSMSAILPAGMRAVAINIDSQGSTSAGGFILPNDRVDVIRTYSDDSNKVPGSASANLVSEMLLRNVRVLAIGQNVQDKNGQASVAGSTATLELDPVQAETVILAQRNGQLSLALRSIQDANQDTGPAAKTQRNLTVVRFGQTVDGGPR